MVYAHGHRIFYYILLQAFNNENPRKILGFVTALNLCPMFEDTSTNSFIYKYINIELLMMMMMMTTMMMTTTATATTTTKSMFGLLKESKELEMERVRDGK